MATDETNPGARKALEDLWNPTPKESQGHESTESAKLIYCTTRFGTVEMHPAD